MSESAANFPPIEGQGATMPEASVGRVLQRGGEELLLEKVSDRFTVQASEAATVEKLVEQSSARVSSMAMPRDLTEVVVSPAQRDQVMEQARATDEIGYASHVYQLEQDPGSRVYLTNQMTVQFRADLSQPAIEQLAAEFGLQLLRAVPEIANTFVLQSTAAAMENPVKITNRLMQRPEVLVAEPDVIIRTQAFYRPKDPIYPKQWHLNHSGGTELVANSHIAAEAAWDVTRGVRSVVVAVMDDSVEVSHPDFRGAGKLVAPRDFLDNDFLPMPGTADDNHGTACAGVAIAEENGFGAVGVAPGCALMPIRTSGYLDDTTIEDLFDWAVTKGAAVVSCSWGPAAVYYPLSLRQRNALTRAATNGRNGKGCVIVFAAGNSNRPTNSSVNETGWPSNFLKGSTAWLNGFAAHPDVVAVAASTSQNRKAAYSCWGAEISVCAPSNNAPPGVGLPQLGYVLTPPEVRSYLPGLGVVTTDRRGSVGYDPSDVTSDFGGTSSACPVVAGVAALILSANPDLSAAEVKQILQQSADKIVDTNPDPQFGFRKGSYEASGRCDWFGYGKVNAFKAVQAAVRLRKAAIATSRRIQAQNTSAQPIPDNDPRGVVSAIEINEANAIQDIQISVLIEHAFLGDLDIHLIPPTGAAILLQGRTLGRQTRWETTYSLQTTLPLKQVIGQSARGRWQLRVTDAAVGDIGTLQRWGLSLGI